MREVIHESPWVRPAEQAKPDMGKRGSSAEAAAAKAKPRAKAGGRGTSSAGHATQAGEDFMSERSVTRGDMSNLITSLRYTTSDRSKASESSKLQAAEALTTYQDLGDEGKREFVQKWLKQTRKTSAVYRPSAARLRSTVARTSRWRAAS